MHKSHKILLAAALAAGTVFQATAQAADMSIATIRTERVLREAPQAQEIRAKLQADFERRANELQAEAKRFEEEANKFQREKDIMSPADRAKFEKRLYEQQVDIKLKGENLQKEAAQRERELTFEGMKAINSVIEAVAKERGVDVVLRDPVYIRDGLTIDITEDVLKRLGKK